MKRILVSRLRFMGDIILTTPLLNALRQAFPDSHITYLAETPYSSILQYHTDVDEIISLNRKSRKSEIATTLKLLTSKFDLAIDLFGNPRSAQLIFLSGARQRIGGDFRGRKIFYTDKIKHSNDPKTAIQFHLGYLSPLQITYKVVDPYIVISKEEELWAQEYLKRKGIDTDSDIIGIHPGATWPAKRWFPNRFAVLANRLFSEKNVNIFFTMGPGEEELVQSVIKSCNFSVIEPDVLPLRKLAAVLKQFDVYISNDCGPMHLAPAVGTKTIGIFGPGEPEIWFPYRAEKGHQVIHHQVDCSRCHRDLCDDLFCMEAISVDKVYDAAIKALNFKRTE